MPLFIAKFHGEVWPSDRHPDCPLKKKDFEDEEDYEEVSEMSNGDTFSFTETQILKADSLEDANTLAQGMVFEWHTCHWTDCQWEVGDITEIKSLKDVLKVLQPVTSA